LICFLFNLIADFKREVTQNEAPRLMTLRTRQLVIGAIRGTDGRQQILRLGLRGHWRQRLPPCSSALPRSPFQLCGAVYQPPKKSSAQALETASVPLPTKLTSSVQMMFLG
jgi:hypothetical protein